MIAIPDPSTFQIIPWTTEAPVARMFCDIRDPDGTPFDGDPRCVLKRQLQRAADLGFTFYVGPELEFFYFKLARRPAFLDHGGYFDLTPARRRDRLPQAHRAVPRGDGHPRRVRAPRGRAEPARDRPALHRRADDGRQRDDLPPHRQGGRAGVRRLRDVHAEAGRRRERQRHAHPPVAVRGRPQRLLRRRPTSTTCRRPAKHYIAGMLRHAPEITLAHEPVGELLQAPRARLRGAGLRLLGAAQPHRRSCACRSTSPARRRRRASSTARPTPPATRTSRSPRCSPPGSAGIERELRAAARGVQQHLRDERGRARDCRHRVAARGPASRRSASPSIPRCSAMRSANTSTSS